MFAVIATFSTDLLSNEVKCDYSQLQQRDLPPTIRIKIIKCLKIKNVLRKMQAQYVSHERTEPAVAALTDCWAVVNCTLLRSIKFKTSQ